MNLTVENKLESDPRAGSPLFRPKSVDARKDVWLGRAILLRPISISLALILIMLSTIVVVIFLFFGEYTRRVRLRGVVVPDVGVVRISAPVMGHIAGVNVVEGQLVQKGQSLYSIELDSTTTLGQTQAAISLGLRKQRAELMLDVPRKISLDKIAKAGLLDQEKGLLREAVQLDVQIDIAVAALEAMRIVTTNYSELVKKGIVLERQAFDRMESYRQKEKELAGLRREAIQVDQKLSDARARISEFDIKSAMSLSEIQRNISAINNALMEGESKRQLEIIAPSTGVATAALVQNGQFVSAGSPLVSILPADARLEIQLYAPSNSIGFIRKGARVMLRYAAFPHEKFGSQPGIVAEFSQVTIRQDDLNRSSGSDGTSVTSREQATGVYKIVVRPKEEFVLANGKTESIRPGMDVEADILLEKRRIYEWLLEPLYGMRGTLVTHENKEN